MANPHRGEYEFEANGKRNKLFFSADAICSLEEELDLGLNDIGERMRDAEKLRMSMVRTMFRVALVDADEAECEALFRSLRPVDAVAHVIRAFALAFGTDDGGERSDRPTQPGADGTGPAFMQTGSSSGSTLSNSGTRRPSKFAAS